MIDFQFSVFLSVFQTASSALVGWLFAAVLLGFAIVLQIRRIDGHVQVQSGCALARNGLAFRPHFFCPKMPSTDTDNVVRLKWSLYAVNLTAFCRHYFAPGATLGESTRHTPTGRMNDANEGGDGQVSKQ
uniref:Secreted protein n=1 Tax=Globodera pallida TaxID=36090 RepID=A0A183BUS7_GLOPA